MWYSCDGLPKGSNAAAFLPPPPPVVTDAADSSMGLVTSTVSLLVGERAPAPASVGRYAGAMGDPGMETGLLARFTYIARPVSTFCRLVPIRHNEQLPVPATSSHPAPVTAIPASRRPRFLGKGQVGWNRAFQRWPNTAGS